MRKAEYILVRLSELSDVPCFDVIADSVYSLAKIKDSIYPECAIQWGLEKLRDLGLFADVHTWPETKFVDWAKKNLLLA